MGFAASNLGIISFGSPVYLAVVDFLMPLAMPLLFLRADLRRVIKSIGKLLQAFFLGSTANYVVISDSLGVSPSVLATANIIFAVYFTSLFAFWGQEWLPSLQHRRMTSTTIAISLAICKAGAFLMKYLGIPGGSLTAITAAVILLATLFPPIWSACTFWFSSRVIGSSGNLSSMTTMAPSIFLLGLAQAVIHQAVILELAPLQQTKRWSSMVIPSILAGIFGIAIATFLVNAFGFTILRFM
ncbi:hypothetical protein MLD38_033528 [Melastoma candidum]|uniref:Uncharacterized protein n=1 Tax=Melastoma candidum TaxID=119954 RepID=A0ACB9M9A8_9MYRT|nr:hypothetical protein MLD38_033528 [Melastoma candidum]